MVKIGGDGLDPERVTRHYLTHFHSDHAGGAAVYRERLGLSVSTFEGAKAALEADDEGASGIAAGLIADDFRLRARRLHDPLVDGAVQTMGDFILTCVADSRPLCEPLLVPPSGRDRRALLAGDALCWAGQVLLQSIDDCGIPQPRETILRLDALAFESLLPAHAAITSTQSNASALAPVSGGHQVVARAASVVRQLDVPRNLV